MSTLTLDDVTVRALDAAHRQMLRWGIRRLTMEDVAREAGIGRATLYRRFATRDELVGAVLAREARRALEAIALGLPELRTAEDRLVEAFARAVELAGTHPLPARLLELEPDTLLPHATVGATAVLGMARDLVATLLAEGQATGELRPFDTVLEAEAIVRLAPLAAAHARRADPAGGPAAARLRARTRRRAAASRAAVTVADVAWEALGAGTRRAPGVAAAISTPSALAEPPPGSGLSP